MLIRANADGLTEVGRLGPTAAYGSVNRSLVIGDTVYMLWDQALQAHSLETHREVDKRCFSDVSLDWVAPSHEAGPVRPEESDDLPRLDPEADPGDRLHLPLDAVPPRPFELSAPVLRQALERGTQTGDGTRLDHQSFSFARRAWRLRA